MEISFREAIKLVHPDMNPNIKDAGTKVSLLKSNKNNPKRIYALMVSWGLVNKKPQPKKQFKIIELSCLKSNTIYNGDVAIQHKNGNRYFVKRTTNARCYFMDFENMKFCHKKSVKHAWMIKKG